MMAWRLSVNGAAMVGALAFAAATVSGQAPGTPAPAVPDAPPPPPPISATPPPAATAVEDTAESLAAWVAEHMGELEGVVGAKLEGVIPVRIASTEALAERIAASMEVDMVGSKRLDGSPMSATEVHIRAMAAAYKVAGRTFGLYSREDRVVYVSPENVKKFAKKYGWSVETVLRAPRLAVAHELVHAIQDQRCALGERLWKLSGEERAALVALSEGQAVWATDQLAKKLDWTAASGIVWGLIAGARDEEDSRAKVAATPKLGIAPPAELYALGKAFVEQQAGKAGDGKAAERVWAIMKAPPTTLAELREPGKFEIKGAGENPAAPDKTRPTDKP